MGEGMKRAFSEAKVTQRIYHMAAQINDNGDVSALCFVVPKPINLKIATWTNRPETVTCPKCRRALLARSA